MLFSGSVTPGLNTNRGNTVSVYFGFVCKQEEAASPVGSDKVAEEEGEDLDDEEEYDEEEEEEDDDRPRKKPRHGGFILDEAGGDGLFLLRFSLRYMFRG